MPETIIQTIIFVIGGLLRRNTTQFTEVESH